jgi:hypothetical protein
LNYLHHLLQTETMMLPQSLLARQRWCYLYCSHPQTQTNWQAKQMAQVQVRYQMLALNSLVCWQSVPHQIQTKRQVKQMEQEQVYCQMLAPNSPV